MRTCQLPTQHACWRFCLSSTTKLFCDQWTMETTAFFPNKLLSSPVLILSSSPTIVFSVYYSNFLQIPDENNNKKPLQLLIWSPSSENKYRASCLTVHAIALSYFLLVLSYHVLHHDSVLMWPCAQSQAVVVITPSPGLTVRMKTITQWPPLVLLSEASPWPLHPWHKPPPQTLDSTLNGGRSLWRPFWLWCSCYTCTGL